MLSRDVRVARERRMSCRGIVRAAIVFDVAGADGGAGVVEEDAATGVEDVREIELVLVPVPEEFEFVLAFEVEIETLCPNRGPVPEAGGADW